MQCRAGVAELLENNNHVVSQVWLAIISKVHAQAIVLVTCTSIGLERRTRERDVVFVLSQLFFMNFIIMQGVTVISV